MSIDNLVGRNLHHGKYDLTLSKVAKLSGKSPRTVRRWVQTGLRNRGRLPAKQTVNGLRFRTKDVELFLESQSTPGRAEPPLSGDNDAVSRLVDGAPSLSERQMEQLATVLGGGKA